MNTSGQSFYIGFEFNGPANFTRVELDLFNCPEWGIAAQSITVYEFNFGILNFDAAIARRLNLVLGWTTTNASSCTSIVRVVIPLLELPQNPTTSFPSYVIDFTFDNTATSYSIQWVHIAEVRFLEEEGTQCPTPSSTAGMKNSDRFHVLLHESILTAVQLLLTVALFIILIYSTECVVYLQLATYSMCTLQ